MRYLIAVFSVLVLLGGCATTTPTVETASAKAPSLEVRKITGDVVDQFRYASASDARQVLSGYTLLLYARGGTVSQGDLMPFSGNTVIYFAPNGQLLAWSDEAETVQSGEWFIDSRGDSNEFCFAFPKGGDGLCTQLEYLQRYLKESTKGNPFGLKANQPVPGHIGWTGDLNTLAQKYT